LIDKNQRLIEKISANKKKNKTYSAWSFEWTLLPEPIEPGGSFKFNLFLFEFRLIVKPSNQLNHNKVRLKSDLN